MKRVSVSFSDTTLLRLRGLAADQGVTVATLVREAVDEKLAATRPRPRSLGAGKSGFTDTGRLAGEWLPEPPPWRS